MGAIFVILCFLLVITLLFFHSLISKIYYNDIHVGQRIYFYDDDNERIFDYVKKAPETIFDKVLTENGAEFSYQDFFRGTFDIIDL